MIARSLAPVAALALAASAHAACPVGGQQTAVAGAVEPGLALRLADGRMLRLAGVEAAGSTPDRPDLADATRDDLARRAEGRELTFEAADARPDRWGRLSVFVFLHAAGPLSSEPLNVAVLRAGLGRYLPEPDAHACRDDLLAAEGEARRDKRGLWADSYYAVLSPGERSAAGERSATLVVLEGRLTAVEAGPYRTKLRFAPDDRAGKTAAIVATILPRAMKQFEAQAIRFPSLIGRRMRLRGLLDVRFGPQVGLEGPDALELLPAASDQPHATAGGRE